MLACEWVWILFSNCLYTNDWILITTFLVLTSRIYARAPETWRKPLNLQSKGRLVEYFSVLFCKYRKQFQFQKSENMTVDFDFNLHFATCCQVVVSFLRARSVSFYISNHDKRAWKNWCWLEKAWSHTKNTGFSNVTWARSGRSKSMSMAWNGRKLYARAPFCPMKTWSKNTESRL